MTDVTNPVELVTLLGERCDQDFDGECHLTTAEAHEIITALSGLVGENERLRTALEQIAAVEPPLGPDTQRCIYNIARASLEAGRDE